MCTHRLTLVLWRDYSKVAEGIPATSGGYTGNERREYPKNAEGVPEKRRGSTDNERRVE